MDTLQQDQNRSLAVSDTRRYDLLALGLTLFGLGVAVVFSLLSDGVYMDDDITHYLFAYDGWSDTHALLHRWARPGYNVPLAPVAYWTGFLGCRMFSALQTALTAWLAYCIARRLMGRGWIVALVPALLWMQPMVLRLATTTLTETPGMLYLTAGVWLYLRGNRILGCAAVSLLFITRDECLALAPLMGLAVLMDAYRGSGGSWKKAFLSRETRWAWACILALLWAPLAYVLAAVAVDLPLSASPLGLFARKYSSEYGSGAWYWYPLIWAEAVGVGLIVLGILGAMGLRGKGWLISTWVFGLLALQGVLFRFGLFASGGYSRFLVPVSGLLAVLAAAGMIHVLHAARENRPWRVLAVFALLGVWMMGIFLAFSWYVPWLVSLGGTAVAVLGMLAVVCLWHRPAWRGRLVLMTIVAALALVAVHLGIVARPLMLDNSPVHKQLSTAMNSLQQKGLLDAPMITQHTLIAWKLSNARKVGGNLEGLDAWRAAKPGTIFFWESHYCNKPHEPETTQALIDGLERLGTKIYEEDDSTIIGPVRIVLYVRGDRYEAASGVTE